MNRDKVFKHYISFYDALAGPSNLAPETLYIIYRYRRHFKSILNLYFGDATDLSVCNVGIGQGDWDLYVSFELGSKGKLTSIEIRTDSYEVHKDRLEIQKHPYDVEVLNEDVNATSLPPESVDLLTIVGSTVQESGKYQETLDSCIGLIRSGGVLFYADFPKYHALDDFFVFAQNRPIEILDVESDKNPDLPFYLITVRKTS